MDVPESWLIHQLLLSALYAQEYGCLDSHCPDFTFKRLSFALFSLEDGRMNLLGEIFDPIDNDIIYYWQLPISLASPMIVGEINFNIMYHSGDLKLRDPARLWELTLGRLGIVLFSGSIPASCSRPKEYAERRLLLELLFWFPVGPEKTGGGSSSISESYRAVQVDRSKYSMRTLTSTTFVRLINGTKMINHHGLHALGNFLRKE